MADVSQGAILCRVPPVIPSENRSEKVGSTLTPQTIASSHHTTSPATAGLYLKAIPTHYYDDMYNRSLFYLVQAKVAKPRCKARDTDSPTDIYIWSMQLIAHGLHQFEPSRHALTPVLQYDQASIVSMLSRYLWACRTHPCWSGLLKPAQLPRTAFSMVFDPNQFGVLFASGTFGCSELGYRLTWQRHNRDSKVGPERCSLTQSTGYALSFADRV